MWPFKKKVEEIHTKTDYASLIEFELNKCKDGIEMYPGLAYIIQPHIDLYEKQLEEFKTQGIK